MFCIFDKKCRERYVSKDAVEMKKVREDYHRGERGQKQTNSDLLHS